MARRPPLFPSPSVSATLAPPNTSNCESGQEQRLNASDLTMQLRLRVWSLILPAPTPMICDPEPEERQLLLRARSIMRGPLSSRRFSAVLCMGLFLAVAARGGSSLAVAQPQAAALQTYPERRAPSQEAVPGLPPKERPAPTPPKTEQYTLSQDRYEKAVAYSRAEYVLYLLSYILSLAVLVLFLKLGVAAKFRDLAESVSGNRFLQGLVFVPLLVLALDLFEFPLRLYAHTLSRRYDQSIQGWGSWFWDWSKAELLGIGFALVLVLLLFVVMRWSPRRWWFHFWLASLPILLLMTLIVPWFIDPMFN